MKTRFFGLILLAFALASAACGSDKTSRCASSDTNCLAPCESAQDCPVGTECVEGTCLVKEPETDGDSAEKEAESPVVDGDKGDTESEVDKNDTEKEQAADGDTDSETIESESADTELAESGLAYGRCDTSADCQAGYRCVNGRDKPRYGFCSKDCASDTECPPAPNGNQYACDPKAKLCVVLCGAYGGSCPDWLECIADQVCLEPSDTIPTKGPGGRCTGPDECLNNMPCVEGDNTKPYCAPRCTTNEDCKSAAPNASGSCASGVCIFMCGLMAGGLPCPGDMTCEGGAVCR